MMINVHQRRDDAGLTASLVAFLRRRFNVRACFCADSVAPTRTVLAFAEGVVIGQKYVSYPARLECGVHVASLDFTRRPRP